MLFLNMRPLALMVSVAFQALFLGLAIFAATTGAARAAPSDRVLGINIDGAISVAAARQISRADRSGQEGKRRGDRHPP